MSVYFVVLIKPVQFQVCFSPDDGNFQVSLFKLYGETISWYTWHFSSKALDGLPMYKEWVKGRSLATFGRKGK